jgi:hypothetical protein
MPMPRETLSIQTFEQLHAWVHEVLCQKENLLEEMFTTRATLLMRGGVRCGRQFTLQGPRCVKLSAVWAADQNVVYFYDTRGQRYRKVDLPHRLTNEAESAAA